MRDRIDPPGFWPGVWLAAPLLLIPLIAFVINPAWLAWSRCPVWPGVRWLGAALALAGLAGALWTFSSLAENLSRKLGIRAHGRLITSGPYRFVRHPLYSSGLLMCAGVALVLASWLAMVGVGIAAAAIRSRIPAEEAVLREHYGDAYRDYERRSGALMPRWGRPR